MSLNQFITNIFNIKSKQIQELLTLNQSDGSMVIKIRLIDAHCACPYCNGQAHIHGYYQRKLTHSTFINRACTILYLQRRYRCNTCQITFNEPNPFTHAHKGITHETKLNILQDLERPEITYTLAASRHHVPKTMVLRILIGISVSHENQCLKFYLLMNTIYQTPTMILFTAISSWILLQGSSSMCFPIVRKLIFSILLVILNMKHIPMKLTPASWIASNMFQLTCLNRSALSFSHIVRRPLSVPIVFMSCSISLKISMQFV